MMNTDFLKPELKKNLDLLNIKSFTPIQSEAIPLINEGKNLIGLSETGSGKTLAFLLPLINKLIGTPKKPTKVLIITPTKELSHQILKVAKTLARETNILSAEIYGGQNANEQLRDFNHGKHLYVACPGRLKDHIEKETMDFSEVETVVLDEADQLMDMGFFPHLEVILENTKNRKQTLLFSATMNEDVKKVVDSFMGNYQQIEYKANQTKESITEFFCPINDELKYPFVRFLLKHLKVSSAIIFTNTKEEARVLFNYMSADKYKVALLEGDMTTHQRNKSIMNLKEKNIKFLIATDIASRGLDIPHVTHVINLTPPLYTDAYVHRVGRTARHDKNGMSVTLYNPEELEKLKSHLEKLQKDFKFTKFKEFNYNLKIEKRHLQLI